jgi:phenylacetate-CoA ligase
VKSLSRKSPGWRWAREHLLPTDGARAAWAFQEKLEQSQWYTPAQHRAYQQKRLGELIRHAEANVPHYADTFRMIALDTRREFTPEHWLRIPLLSRSDLQQRERELTARRVPPGHGVITRISSSGSTGSPVNVLATELTASWNRALNLRGYLWALRSFDCRVAVIRAFRPGQADYPVGVERPAWDTELAVPLETGPLFGLAAATPTNDQVEWLNRIQPSVLLAYPSVLGALLNAAETGELRMQQLDRVITISETLDDEVRERARKLLGVGIFDIYSANEVGPLALQCPEGKVYHIPSEAVLLEVLDRDGQPCRAGEAGRVVITLLHSYATPVIRYDIGDIATVGQPCRCGRGLPVLTRIIGRQRNMMIGPNGERFRPRLGWRLIREIAPVTQGQFIQHSVDKLEGKLVVARPLTPGEESLIRQHLSARMPQATEIVFTYVDEIQRSGNGKFEDFVSLLDRER